MSDQNKLLGTWDFADVSLIIGIKKMKGFEEGTEITAERDEDSFTKKTGVDGGVSRTKSNNFAGFMEFSLNALSTSNAYLNGIVTIDERTGKGVVPAVLTSKSSGEKILGTEGWLVRPANFGGGKESGARVWRMDFSNINFLNTNISQKEINS